MTVPQQCSQVPLLGRGHPDRGKAIFHRQQVQYQACIPPVMFLLSRLGSFSEAAREIGKQREFLALNKL